MADEKARLKHLAALKSSIKKNGAIWVIFPKGKQHIKEIEVLQKGREAGLVDTKVVSFSADCTAHKFVIRVSDR
jgi:ATP-dependent helicase/DNAse subunit B